MILRTLPLARLRSSEEFQEELLACHANDLSTSDPASSVKPPPSAVSFLGPPAENAAPVAEPVPWNAWLRVTVVPEMPWTIAPAGSVSAPAPLVMLTSTPGARFSVSLTF